MQQDTQDFEKVYDQFIRQVLTTGKVWGLCDTDDNWAVCESSAFEDTDVMPFWSSETGAAHHCSDEWQHYQPTSIDLEEFLVDWLPGLHEDDALVGPDWDTDLEGLEIEPADVAQELEAGQKG